MLKRQISLLAISTLLLSPTLVHADEIGKSTNISVGNIQIKTDGYGGTNIQTPNVQISTPQPFVNQWLMSSRKRRIRTSVRKPVLKSGQIISAPAVMRQPPIDSPTRSVVTQTSTIRSTSQTSNNGAHSEQHSSVECSSSGSGTSVTRSTQTINGRTVSEEVRTNCP
jgi:hypothetical protein